MTSNNNFNNDKATPANPEAIAQSDRLNGRGDRGVSDDSPSNENLATGQADSAIATLQAPHNSQYQIALPQSPSLRTANPRASLLTLVAIALIFLGLALNNFLIGFLGTLLAVVLLSLIHI